MSRIGKGFRIVKLLLDEAEQNSQAALGTDLTDAQTEKEITEELLAQINTRNGRFYWLPVIRSMGTPWDDLVQIPAVNRTIPSYLWARIEKNLFPEFRDDLRQAAAT